MEENRLTHNINMPTWNTRKPTSQSQSRSPHPASIFSLEQNDKLMNSNIINTQEYCKSPNVDKAKDENGKVELAETGRERLKRHREEVMGRVKVPENWGQEKLLKEWIDCTAFDPFFAPHRLIVTARDALVADGRKARSQRLRIQA